MSKNSTSFFKLSGGGGAWNRGENEGVVILRENGVDTPMHTIVSVKILSHLAVVEQFLGTKLLTPLERKIILNGKLAIYS